MDTVIKKRLTINNLIKLQSDRNLVALTSYTANIARISDRYADIILVGDSLGMVLYGFPSTMQTTLDMMLAHGECVVRSTSNAFIVVDMPFGTYEESRKVAFKNASAIMAKTGCGAIKLEGGAEMSETIKFLVERGIPVMAHIGLMPQKFKLKGNFSKEKDETKVLKDLEAVVVAGAFSVVLENISHEISEKIALEFPSVLTIGIGAGKSTKGQIAVLEDLCGLSGEFIPPFYKKIQDLQKNLEEVLGEYRDSIISPK
jgi:3-methyl-2-oxobutanoate hydroxymethyltransferase